MNITDILMIHGTDYKEMAKEILAGADVAALIGERAKKVGLKPNFLADIPASDGATTHPELLDGALEYLRENGFHNLAVMEGAWAGARTGPAFRNLGFEEVCRKNQVPFFDLQKDRWKTYDAAGMEIRVCDQAMNVDFMINMPVVKGHCQTKVTCALKNNKGVIPNDEKRRFHSMGLHKPIAHLNTIVRNDFILADNICGDLDFEEGGSPVIMNRVLGFRDPVLCDAFVCECFGYTSDDVPYIRMAEKLGVGSADVEHARVISLNEAESEMNTRHKEGKEISIRDRFFLKDAEGSEISLPGRVKRLAAFAEARDACSVCYGSLIMALKRLDEQGFIAGRKEKVCIGQGWRGEAGKIGVGRCTSCFENFLPGCPPKTGEIIEFLKETW